MTVGIGIDSGDRVWLAADTLCLGGYNRRPSMRKIIALGSKHAVAASGIARTVSLIESHQGRLEEAAKKSAQDFATELRQVLIDDGYQRDSEDGAWSHNGSAVMFAGPSGLWLVDPSFHAIKCEERMPYGIGSGGEFAMGSLYTMLCYGAPIDERSVRFAAATAFPFSAGCGGQIDVWTVGRNGSGGFKEDGR